jgi:ComF family protein
VSLLFPDVCRVCETALKGPGRVPVCRACLEDADPYVPEFFCVQCRTPFLNAFPLDENGHCSLCRLGGTRFEATYTAGVYDGALRRLIHLFKYEGVLSLSGPLSAMLFRAIPRREQFDLIVPAPMHWTRRLARGFNQAEILARDLGRLMGVPVASGILKKKRVRRQAGLTRNARRLNVAGAVTATAAAAKGARVLLVDDVYTTGATANACALALQRAGARSVAVAAVARADRRISVSPISIHREEDPSLCRA